MKNIRRVIGVLLFCSAGAPALAQPVDTHVTASNGVVVDVNTDDFAAKIEYTSPTIQFQVPSGLIPSIALVGLIKQGGINGKLGVQGAVFYRGDWHYYNSAIFKGGDPVTYTAGDRKVLSCSSGCSFSESFSIALSPSDIAKHTENGVLPIQLRPQASTEVVLLEIPSSYFDAVNDVAKVQEPQVGGAKRPTTVSNPANVAAAHQPSKHVCSHEEQVQARIARQNGYTGAPKCE